MKKNYQIIYLNGPSSVGKTTVARALQNELKTLFLVVGIDQVIDMMPAKANDWNEAADVPGFSPEPVENVKQGFVGYRIHSGPFGERMVQALKDIVLALAKSNYSIIIDDVSIGKKEVDAWHNALKKFQVLWVGLTAPLNVLEQRERDRHDRKLGLARWQAEHVHVGVDYDLMIDTYEMSVDESVAIIKNRMLDQ